MALDSNNKWLNRGRDHSGLAPGAPTVLNSLAWLHAAAQRFGEAKTLLFEVLRRRPQDAVALSPRLGPRDAAVGVDRGRAARWRSSQRPIRRGPVETHVPATGRRSIELRRPGSNSIGIMRR